MTMQWRDLLSTRRLGQAQPKPSDDPRSPYEIDVDRFIFSSAFRRLQSKMQVHGVSLHADRPSDYVRNRLTHSLEVSRVGRSLGQLAGQHLIRCRMLDGVTAADIGHIVSAASIAHDVGQTPFSHEGEQAISAWWSESAVAQEILSGLPPSFTWELTRFEGNAFGFRLLTRLEGWKPHGGLQLTSAVLGAFAKYPWLGGLAPDLRPHPRKYGLFGSELELFEEVARATGLVQKAPGVWCRHPLAHLTEAADDICYRIVDVEDAVQMGALAFEEAEALLAPLARPDKEEYGGLEGVVRKLTYLRARAIASLIANASAAWADLHDRMLAGDAVPELLSLSPFGRELDVIAEVSRQRIYRGGRRAETVLIATNTLTSLLETYGAMLLRREQAESDAGLALRDQAVLAVLCRDRDAEIPFARERGQWVRALMDHIACLTDHAALREVRLLTGGL
jgi:dGTPase